MNENKIQPWQLAQRQSLPLDAKITMTKMRIRAWYEYWQGQVYVAFSGGKDSTVLLDLVRSIYPHIPGVFCDTGLEFPEIREFVRTIENVVWLKPKMSFKDVIDKYGYPVVSKEQSQFLHEVRTTNSDNLRCTRLHGNKSGRGKVANKWKYLIDAPFKISHKCCDVMKKEPSRRYELESGRRPIIGTMTGESSLRHQKYLREGCNAFKSKRPSSTPLAFWLEKDIWEYLRTRNVPYSSIYDKGYARTGCMFCAFGAHRNCPNRFQRMQETHPKLWKYCMDNLGMRDVLTYCGIPCQTHQTLFDWAERQP